MNLVLIANTADNVRELNRSRQFREQISAIANDQGRKTYLTIINDGSLTDTEKRTILCYWGLLRTYHRIQMVWCGQKKWKFPQKPIADQFLNWYMELPLPLGPIERYTWLIIAAAVGDHVFEAVSKDEIEMPAILNDLAEIKTAQSASLQQAMRDFITSFDSTFEIEMPIFSQDTTLERIANSLAKPFVSKANRAINDGESRWNDALEGVWKGSKGLLKQPAIENFRNALIGSELQNYLRKAIKNQLGQEMRKVIRDRARKEAKEYIEIIESGLPLARDDEGNWVSPLELIPDISQEDIESLERELLEALQLAEEEKAIWAMRAEGKTKKQIAKELGISRPTLDRYLAIMREKVRDLPPDELGISLFRPGSMKIPGKRHQWQATPDPTAYMAIVKITRQELYKLGK